MAEDKEEVGIPFQMELVQLVFVYVRDGFDIWEYSGHKQCKVEATEEWRERERRQCVCAQQSLYIGYLIKACFDQNSML